MKKIFLISILFFILLTTSLHSSAFGQEGCGIKGNVTWEYNKYVGIKADTGAKVYLFKRIKQAQKYEPLFPLDTDKKKGVYVTQVNMMGQYEFNKLPAGIYDLLIISKATRRCSIDTSNIDKLKKMCDRDNMRALTEKIDDRNNMRALTELIEATKFVMFQNCILKPHFLQKAWKNAELILLSSNKYEVHGELNLEPGDEKEINVDFGNTFF